MFYAGGKAAQKRKAQKCERAKHSLDETDAPGRIFRQDAKAEKKNEKIYGE
jgi:hypothetical protein